MFSGGGGDGDGGVAVGVAQQRPSPLSTMSYCPVPGNERMRMCGSFSGLRFWLPFISHTEIYDLHVCQMQWPLQMGIGSSRIGRTRLSLLSAIMVCQDATVFLVVSGAALVCWRCNRWQIAWNAVVFSSICNTYADVLRARTIIARADNNKGDGIEIRFHCCAASSITRSPSFPFPLPYPFPIISLFTQSAVFA